MLSAWVYQEIASVNLDWAAFAKPMLQALRDNPGRWDISSLEGMVSSGVMWSPEVKQGLLEFNDKMNAAFAAGTGTEYGDAYFMTQPRFETGDERYAWLNRLVTVGEGRLIPSGVEYRLYACENG